MIFVYVILLDNKTFYCGLTNNIERRLKEHRRNNKGFTGKFKTVELLHFETFENRKQARKKEIKIKNRGAYIYLLKLNPIKYGNYKTIRTINRHKG